jgi:hypothetical protein
LRKITRDDITAPQIVIHTSFESLIGSMDTERWRPNLPDGSRTSDGTIIKLMLSGRLSARDIGGRLGLDHSGVAKRFKAAIATISWHVGPMVLPPPRLFPQNGLVAPRVERRIGKPTFKPQPATDDRIAEAELRLLAWAQLHARKVLGIEPTRYPPGCAEGYPDYGQGRFLSRPSVVNEDDDQAAPTLKGKLNTESQYRRLPPAAFKWRKLAGELPDGAFKDLVIAREDVIADLLVDTRWPPRPYWPDSDEVSRWSVGWFNNGLPYNRAPDVCEIIIGWWSTPWVHDPSLRPAQRICGIFNDGSVFWWPSGGAHLVPAPRKYSANVSSAHFCGPAIEVKGRLRPRGYIDVDAVFNDTATRFERALTRAEETLFLSTEVQPATP